MEGSDAAGSINVSSILTGKCLAKINATNGSPEVEECSSSTRCSRKSNQSSHVRSTVTEALEDITSLLYDEERMKSIPEIDTRQGFVHVWSN